MMRTRGKKLVFSTQLFAFIFLLIFSSTASAQKKEIEKITKFIKKKRVNAAYVMFGGSNLSLTNLNLTLESRGLPKVDEYYLSYGFGGHVINNKIVAGIEFLRVVKKESPGTEAFNTSIGAQYTVLNFGYLLHSKKGLMYYPYVGVGVGELKLRTIENNIDSFDDITDYQRGSESRTFNFLLNIGFALDLFYRYNRRKRGQNNLVVGVRAGYILSPVRLDWRVNHTWVDDGPDSGITGPYIRFVIGLGGWMEKLIKKVT